MPRRTEQRNIRQRLARLHTSQHQSAPAHVSPTNEFRREHQVFAEDGQQGQNAAVANRRRTNEQGGFIVADQGCAQASAAALANPRQRPDGGHDQHQDNATQDSGHREQNGCSQPKRLKVERQ